MKLLSWDLLTRFYFKYSEIFPYLIIILGVENILVITKSVVSTPVDLEVKIRVAQGTLCMLYVISLLVRGLRNDRGGGKEDVRKKKE